MSTEQEVEAEGPPEQDGEPAPERQPNWWHRDHPTFTSLAGFFTGLLFVVLVPSLFIGLLHLLLDDETSEQLFPFVLVTLAVPIGLVIAPRTRRFGTYMLIGLATTAIVVGGVAALVLWYLISRDG